MSTEWTEAQRICDLPAVDEAIRNLLEDNTGDNATCLVREVMRSIAAGAAAATEGVRHMVALLRDPRFTMSGGTEFALEIVAALSARSSLLVEEGQAQHQAGSAHLAANETSRTSVQGGVNAPQGGGSEHWERRSGHRKPSCEFAWCAWAPCNESEALRVTGLQSWQVRKMKCRCAVVHPAAPNMPSDGGDAKDAQRYRWLRTRAENFGHADDSPSPWVVIGTDAVNQHPCSFAALDAAVDAAMQHDGTRLVAIVGEIAKAAGEPQ